MATIHIRDVPDNVVGQIDRSAMVAESRSRETYLRDFFLRTFGADGSVTSAISKRAAVAVEQAEALGRFGALRPEPNLARVARAIGHDGTAVLEAELRGDRQLSFADGDRLCGLLGLDREWLESGEDAGPRYRFRAEYPDCDRLLAAFVENGVPYEDLYFVATDEKSVACIIGNTPSDDPTVGWRYDLLVDDVPLHDDVGATGARQRRSLADLLMAFVGNAFTQIPSIVGRIAPYNQYAGMMNGYVHPSAMVNVGSLGGARAMTRSSTWVDEFPRFRRSPAISPKYAEGREAFLKDLGADGLATDRQYEAFVAKRVAKMRRLRTPTP